MSLCVYLYKHIKFEGTIKVSSFEDSIEWMKSLEFLENEENSLDHESVSRYIP